MCSFSSSKIIDSSGNFYSIHVSKNGSQPSYSAVKYTIPQRETVAGEATARSITSKSIRIWGRSLIRWPLDKHSVMLSSRTVFMFSIQIASTGPSKTVHIFSSDCSCDAILMILEARPSVHSYETKSTSPYSSPIEIALGFKIFLWTTWNERSGWLALRSSVITSASTL